MEHFSNRKVGLSKSQMRVAVLVDADNVSQDHAEALMTQAREIGEPVVLRAYCDRTKPNGWDRDHRFQVVYLDTRTGKNSSDIRLVIDAMDLAYETVVDAFFILSTDRDFAPLAHRLRRFGLYVAGMGRSETSSEFRLACSQFHSISKLEAASAEQQPLIDEVSNGTAQPKAPVNNEATATTFDKKLMELIRNEGDAMGYLIGRVGGRMHTLHKTKISEYPEKTWRAYFVARPHIYVCDPKGLEARVRLKTP